MKTLKIDEKWSILYDPENNDRPEQILRYGENIWTDIDNNWTNEVVAMFYSLLEKEKNEQETVKFLKEMSSLMWHFVNSINDDDYVGPVGNFKVDLVCHFKQRHDIHIEQLQIAAEKVDNFLKEFKND